MKLRITMIFMILLLSLSVTAQEVVTLTQPGQATAAITITSDPTGATVNIDGAEVGVTPITVELPPGEVINYSVTAHEPYQGYNLYKPFHGTLTAPAEDAGISVWLDRTTAEEQKAARDAYAKQRRAQLEASLKDGPWTLTLQTDAITDANRTTIRTPATAYLSRLERNAALFVRCDLAEPSGVAVFFHADTYLGRDPKADYRVDDQPAVQGRRWHGSTDGTSAFVPVSDIPPLINALRSGSTLTARLYDYNSRTYDYTFDVRGIEDALYLQGCYTAL